MINIRFMLGYPVEFKRLGLIYPPKVRETACSAEYGAYQKILTISQEELEDEYVKNHKDFGTLLTPFEYVLNGAYNNREIAGIAKRAFEFFLHEPVEFLYETKQILIGDIKELKSVADLRIINEEDYFDFQNLIREACGSKAIAPYDPNEHPKIKEMKAKARYRDSIKAKQNIGINFSTILTSIFCMGIGLNPLNIGELSYAAIPALIETYQNKERYELDMESLLAGADSKKVNPKYWIRNLDEK